MGYKIFLITLCLIAGIFISIQSPLASLMKTQMGIFQSVFVINACGTVAAGLALLLMRGNFKNWDQLPWYVLLAGVLGVGIVGIISSVVPSMGVASSMALIIAGQLITGMVADQFGWFHLAVRRFDANRLLGVVLLLAGAWFILKP